MSTGQDRIHHPFQAALTWQLREMSSLYQALARLTLCLPVTQGMWTVILSLECSWHWGLEGPRKPPLDTGKRGCPREMLGHVVHVPRPRRLMV